MTFVHLFGISQKSEETKNKNREKFIKKIIVICTILLLGFFIHGLIYTLVNISHYKYKNSLEYLLKLIIVFVILISVFFIPRKNTELMLLIIAMALYTIKYFIVYFYIVSNK
jgi:hypothetical protein